MPKKTTQKKTFIREVILNPSAEWKNSKKDFGIGPGVLAKDEVTYTDIRGRGFNTPQFAVECMEEDDDLFRTLFAVRRTPVKSRS